MKILVLSNLYPPHALGGYEMTCRDSVHRWRNRGHEVSILTTTTRFANVTEPDDPQVHRELDWYWSEHEIIRPTARQRLRIERSNRRRLDRLLDEIRPDVVSVWAMGAMSMSLLARCAERRIPMVMVVGDDWLVYGPRTDGWLSMWSRAPDWLARLATTVSGLPTRPPRLPASDPVAFVSEFTRDRATQRARVGFTRSEVVPPGLDPAEFPPVAPRSAKWSWRLACVGRVEPRKGFDTAVRALADLPEATLQLVGPADPAEHDALLAIAATLGVEARVGFNSVPRSQLAALYRECDVLIFPSRWDEPFGLVPLEAMSQRVPVVATRRGGSAEFLTDGVNCLEIGADDPAAIVTAVRRLAADADLRKRLAAGGVATAVGYDVGRYADDLEALHADAITSPVPVVAPVRDRVVSPSYDGPPPQICVVVSTHNRASLLGGLLDALEQQTGVDAEIVVADNGSTDATWRLLGERARHTTLRLLAVRLPFHDGPGVPRNTAVSLSRAPLIAFTDDDCLPMPGWLDALVRAFDDDDVGQVQGRTQPETGNWQGPWARTVDIAAASGLWETANLACRRESFLRVGGFSAERLLSGRAFGEDAQFGAAIARGAATRFEPAALVRHRMMPGSYRDYLHERARFVGFPALVREVPEIRSKLLGRLFLTRQTLATDIAVAAAVSAVVTRRSTPLLAAAPWIVRCWSAAAGRPGRPRAMRAAQVGLGDLVGLAALVTGSARARRPVL